MSVFPKILSSISLSESIQASFTNSSLLYEVKTENYLTFAIITNTIMRKKDLRRKKIEFLGIKGKK